jgi:iron-sulfur cluster repair protein YtfE (RIC family)
MTTRHAPSEPKAGVGAAGPAFAVLDDCHRQTLVALERLETIVARLPAGVDPQTRALAADVLRHFSTTARQHHLDEERHVFPPLATGSDAGIAQAVLRLQQDHSWLEEDWMTLAPHLDAVACGQSWYDVEFLREGVEIFAALSREHIALEESCLYPEARARISAGAAQAMGREMIERRRAARRAGAGERQRPAS